MCDEPVDQPSIAPSGSTCDKMASSASPSPSLPPQASPLLPKSFTPSSSTASSSTMSSQHHPNLAHLQGLGAGPSATNSVVHRIFHPPKLERKHSSGDLHSRLKTRKILGVGETDNGDIHRSKISQLLGHNEHLYVKFPRGFWLWHLLMAIYITLQGLLAFLVPQHFHMLVFQNSMDEATVDTVFATRLSGGALLGMSIIVWHMQGTTEKAQARMSLAAITTNLLLQIIVNVIFMWHHNNSITSSALSSLGMRTLIVLACVLYHHAIGRSTAGLRKSSSYKDLTTPDKPSRETASDKADADKKDH